MNLEFRKRLQTNRERWWAESVRSAEGVNGEAEEWSLIAVGTVSSSGGTWRSLNERRRADLCSVLSAAACRGSSAGRSTQECYTHTHTHRTYFTFFFRQHGTDTHRSVPTGELDRWEREIRKLLLKSKYLLFLLVFFYHHELNKYVIIFNYIFLL